MENVKVKLLHYLLNLDYPQKNISLQNQTNQLINKIMNDFVVKYGSDFKNKYIVLESQNDTFTLIAYNILKGIQAIIPFQLLIYGRHSVIKKYLKNKKEIKEKFISKRTLLKLNKVDKIIIISCYNPLYQVADFKKFHKRFLKKAPLSNCTYNILDKFTLSELKIARIFYHINWYKFDDIYFKNDICEIYDNFCCGKFPKKGDTNLETLFNNLIVDNKNFEINIVKLTKDNDKNTKLLNQVEDTTGLVFYFINDTIDNYPILFSEYQYYLKNKSNIPNYWNVNTYSIVHRLIEEYNCSITNFIGDFTDKEKKIWEGNTNAN